MNTDAQFVIAGGGAVGCACAYALARSGRTDVLVLERGAGLGLATTAQGAGLCGQARDSLERTRLAMHAVATFRHLQQHAEAKPDWHEVGSIRIALTDSRAAEFNALHATAKTAGLETHLIGSAEARGLWPLMNFNAAKAVLGCPADGYLTPRRLVEAYAHECRRMGVRFATSTPVLEMLFHNGRVAGVKTTQGTVQCEQLINAAGAHAYHLAKLAGLELPIVPVRHEYYVTVPMAGLTPDLPCFRVPDLTLYGRVRDEGLLLGGWEAQSRHTDPRTYDLDPPAIEPDAEVLDRFEESFARLFPAAKGAERKTVGKGWPTFTPDGRFIIGPSSRVPGFVMAGGCNAHGISGSAGIARLLLESLFEPEPSDYVRSLSPDRFVDGQWTWTTACRDAARVYETYYGASIC